MEERVKKSIEKIRLEKNMKLLFEAIEKRTKELNDAIRCSKEIIVKKMKSEDDDKN